MFKKSIIAAVFAATLTQAKDGRTHGVAYFWDGPVVEARMDPIISPGSPQSQHVHTVMGGDGFSVSMGLDDARNAKCTGSKVVHDRSNYWFPKLFFQDPKTKKFEGVDLLQLKAYYFFEGTDDVIKPFPAGFQMVSGNPFLRSNPYKTPWNDQTAYAGSQQEIQPISWTCGRNDNKMAYKQGLVAKQGGSTQGPGFPMIKCDADMASYIHFPSCADLSQPFTSYKNNTVWPTATYHSDGSRRDNCPKGYTHLPHLFLEIHWNTTPFNSRWTEGVDHWPFVTAQGDPTGFGGHADFIAGWDETVLQNLINTCDSGGHGDGLDSCPGVENYDNSHPASCSVKPTVPEVITGKLDALPGCNPIQAGPGAAVMCDCSSGKPVCNGKVTAPEPPAPGPSSIASDSPSKTTTMSTMPANTGKATTTSSAATSTQTGNNDTQTGGSATGNGGSGDDSEDGDDDDGEDDDDDACGAPSPAPKPKVTPTPMVPRSLGRGLSHQRFHEHR